MYSNQQRVPLTMDDRTHDRIAADSLLAARRRHGHEVPTLCHHEVVGADAIAFAGWGVSREVIPPYDESNEECIASGACAFVCPTGAIDLEQVNGTRRLPQWHREMEIQHCTVCCRAIAPVAQLDLFAARTGISRNELNICTDCRSTRFRKSADGAVLDSTTP